MVSPASEAVAMRAANAATQEQHHRRASESAPEPSRHLRDATRRASDNSGANGGKRKPRARHTLNTIRRSLSKLNLFSRTKRSSNPDAPTVHEEEPLGVQRSSCSYTFSNLAGGSSSPTPIGNASASNIEEMHYMHMASTSAHNGRVEPSAVPQEGAPRPQLQQWQWQQPPLQQWQQPQLQQQQQPRERPQPEQQCPVSQLSASSRGSFEDRFAESNPVPAPPRQMSRLSGGVPEAAVPARKGTSLDGVSRRTSNSSATTKSTGRSSVDLSMSVALSAVRESRDEGSEGRGRRGSLDSSVQKFRMQHGRYSYQGQGQQGQENDGSNPGLANFVKTLLVEDKVTERPGSRSSLELERPNETLEVPRGPVGVLVPKWDSSSTSCVRLKPAGSFSRRGTRAGAADTSYARRMSRVSVDSSVASASPLWLSQSMDLAEQDQVMYVAGREKQPSELREDPEEEEDEEEESEEEEEETTTESTLVFQQQKPAAERGEELGGAAGKGSSTVSLAEDPAQDETPPQS